MFNINNLWIFFLIIINVKTITFPLTVTKDLFNVQNKQNSNISDIHLLIFPKLQYIKLLEFKFFHFTYHLEITHNEKMFLLGLSSKFSGIWLKDKNCKDCSVLNNKPVCESNCEGYLKYKNEFFCDKNDCTILKNSYKIQNLKSNIERSKLIESSIFINDKKYENIKIFLALNTIDIKLNKYDGEIGLLYEKTNNNTNIIDILIKSSIVKKSFSLYLNKENTNSHISFGDYKKLYMIDNEFINIDFNPNNFSISINKIQFDLKSFEIINNKSNNLCFECDFLGFPNYIYEEILILLKEKYNFICDTISKYLFCSFSNNSLSDFNLNYMIDNNIFQINTKFLLTQCQILNTESTNKKIENICRFKIKKTSNIIIGIPFFETFYTNFDFELNKIGIAKSQLNINQLEQLKEEFEEFVFSEWRILFIFSCIIIFILLIILIYIMSRRIFRYNRVNENLQSNLVRVDTATDIHNESFIGNSFNFDYEVKDNMNNEIFSASIDEKNEKENIDQNSIIIDEKNIIDVIENIQNIKNEVDNEFDKEKYDI